MAQSLPPRPSQPQSPSQTESQRQVQAGRTYVPYGEGVDMARDLLERSPVPMVVITPDHRIAFVNAETERLFGYRREDLHRRPYEELFPPRERDALGARLDAFFSAPELEPIAFRPDVTAMRKDGTEFPMQYVAMPTAHRFGHWVVVTIFDRTAERAAERRIARLNRSYFTLARMNQAVGRAPSVAVLLEETCRVAVEHGGFLGAWVGQVDDGRMKVVAKAGSVDPYIDGLRIRMDPNDPTSRGVAATAFSEGRPVYVQDFRGDPMTVLKHDDAAAYGIASAVSLPLRLRGRPFAMLSLYGGEEGVFDEEVRDLLEGLAYNVSFALDGFDRAQRLEEVSAQRQQLLERLITAQESERHRIAADLHDDSVQSLAAAELRLSGVEAAMGAQTPDLAAKVAEIRQVLGTTMSSLRELMFDLEPPDTESGLAEALREAAEQVFVDSPIHCEVRAEQVELGCVLRTQTLRIAKEALINVRKHAGATRAELEARREGPGVLFRVRDDGEGFDGEESSRPRHRGMQTMRERAELSGGWFRAAAVPPAGTEVTWWIPVAAED